MTGRESTFHQSRRLTATITAACWERLYRWQLAAATSSASHAGIFYLCVRTGSNKRRALLCSRAVYRPTRFTRNASRGLFRYRACGARVARSASHVRPKRSRGTVTWSFQFSSWPNSRDCSSFQLPGGRVPHVLYDSRCRKVAYSVEMNDPPRPELSSSAVHALIHRPWISIFSIIGRSEPERPAVQAAHILRVRFDLASGDIGSTLRLPTRSVCRSPLTGEPEQPFDGRIKTDDGS